MAFYKYPIRPFDPVVEDDPQNKSTRYYRDNFEGTGQDSHTNPPTQDPSMWEKLYNVMPFVRGTVDRRWGYHNFITDNSTLAFNYAFMYSFQRDTDGLRNILVSSYPNAITGIADVSAYSENGSKYRSAIISPSVTFPVRVINSRSYAYFYNQQMELQKWSGDQTGGVTNWGINVPNTTAMQTVENFGTQAAVGFGSPGWFWQNPLTNLFSPSSFVHGSATQGFPSPSSAQLLGGSFGFSIPSNATINNISVFLDYQLVGVTGPASITVNLIKNGFVYGTAQQSPASINWPTFLTLDFHDPNWGGTWLPNDFNNNAPVIGGGGGGFGVQIIATQTSSNSWALNLRNCSVKVDYTGSVQSIAIGVGAAGGVSLSIGRIYYYCFFNSSTGHISDLSAASGSTGPVTNKMLNLSNIGVSSDSQVDQVILLATADGGDPSVLYFLAEVPNGTTTFTDNIADSTLVLAQQYLFTDQFGSDFGVAANTPPPSGATVGIKHNGRLWLAVGQNLFFSKNVSELTLPDGFIAGKYEESWPQDNYFDVSEGAETISGLLSNGQVLFVGTQRHVRRLYGDSPDNFQVPEVVHPEVGVLNQEVWQPVFVQGSPSGCIWMTPDFRVILSDFNTYQDIGKPIQDILNTIVPGSPAFAQFVADGDYDLYWLCVTSSLFTSPVMLVYNMRELQWVVWFPAITPSAFLYNITSTGLPQWLATTFVPGLSASVLTQFALADLQDNIGVPGTTAANIPVTIRSSWLHLGEPTTRKVLDELEVIGDPATLITIEEASRQSTFVTPAVIVANAPLVQSPFGQYKVYLAGSGAHARYFRLTFTNSGTTSDVLDAYSLKSIPWNKL